MDMNAMTIRPPKPQPEGFLTAYRLEPTSDGNDWESTIRDDLAERRVPFLVLDVRGRTSEELDWDALFRIGRLARLYLLGDPMLHGPTHRPAVPVYDNWTELLVWINRESQDLRSPRVELIPDEIEMMARDGLDSADVLSSVLNNRPRHELTRR